MSIIFIISEKIIFDYSIPQTIIMSVGISIIMYLLYNMRTLLMNSLQNKPTDMIGRFRKFLGHKCLEIYIVHILLFQAILYYALFIKPNGF